MSTPPTTQARQRGAVLVLYAFMLMLLLGFCGLVLDLGMAYYRRAQLQAAADKIAVVAARALDGTAAGVANAVSVAATTAGATRIGFSGSLAWNNAALRFSSSADTADNAWLASGDAASAPAAVLFARVDLGELGDDMRLIEPVLMRALGDTAPIRVSAVAVAGPTAMRITPLAICAQSTTPTTVRANPTSSGTYLNELVNYGFRYGISYNLLRLNPQPGAVDGAYFVVDPVAQQGGDVSDMADDATAAQVVAPFMCAGKIAHMSVPTQLRVRRLASYALWRHMNSRLGLYGPTPQVCTRAGAPPDVNVRNYLGGSANWQSPSPTVASARTVEGAGPLATIADQAPVAGKTYPGGEYGTRWAFGAARNPDGTAIHSSNWATLYPSNPPVTVSASTYWPAGGAYAAGIGGGTYGTSPTFSMFQPGRRERRLMRIALLQCDPMPSLGTAGVLAYGRFFLSAAASSGEVPGEFAGVETNLAALKTDVEVLR